MSAPSPVAPPAPAYRVRTPRLLLRCLEPDDAVQRQDAVDSSGAHLDFMFRRPDGRPIPLETHVASVRKSRGSFDLDQDRHYGVFAPETGRMLGETGLMRRAGLGALELSYWLRQDAAGQGFATEMASALVKVAFERDQVKRLDVMCAPDNTRSAAMARRLGFTLEGRLRDRQLAPYHERGDLLCFTLLASEYPHTPARQLPVECFDFLGRPLP
jgi:RimJ/RimL family protein N-acetyltransferase